LNLPRPGHCAICYHYYGSMNINSRQRAARNSILKFVNWNFFFYREFYSWMMDMCPTFFETLCRLCIMPKRGEFKHNGYLKWKCFVYSKIKSFVVVAQWPGLKSKNLKWNILAYLDYLGMFPKYLAIFRKYIFLIQKKSKCLFFIFMGRSPRQSIRINCRNILEYFLIFF
jgi:hypothetical protein